MTNVILRSALPSDVEGISQCAVAAYDKYIERMGKVPAPMIADFKSAVDTKNVVVACRADELLGYVVFYPIEESMHLENIAVFPSYAGSGTGRKLIAEVERIAAALGLESVELYTNEAMTENLQMYPMLGYQEFDRRSEDGFNRVYFRKSIV